MANTLKKLIGTATLVVALTATSAMAQRQGPGQGGPGGRGQGGPGGFNREEMMDRLMGAVQENLGFADDEWGVVRPMMEDVMELQRGANPGGGLFALMGGGGRGGRGGQGGPGGGRFGGPERSAAEEVLSTTIEEGASAEALKSKLADLRAERKANADKLAKARESLRAVMSAEQEAKLVLAGVLD